MPNHDSLTITGSRELTRLWVRNEELAWDLPEALDRHFKHLFAVKPQDQTLSPLESFLNPRSSQRGSFAGRSPNGSAQVHTARKQQSTQGDLPRMQKAERADSSKKD